MKLFHRPLPFALAALAVAAVAVPAASSPPPAESIPNLPPVPLRRPDLIVQSVEGTGLNLAVVVRNQGTAPAGAHYLFVKFASEFGSRVLPVRVPPLDPGVNCAFKIGVPEAMAKGALAGQIGVVEDALNQVEESIEWNNAVSLPSWLLFP